MSFGLHSGIGSDRTNQYRCSALLGFRKGKGDTMEKMKEEEQRYSNRRAQGRRRQTETDEEERFIQGRTKEKEQMGQSKEGQMEG